LISVRLNHTRGQNNQDHSSFELVFGKQRSRPNWQRFLNNNAATDTSTTNTATTLLSTHQVSYGASLLVQPDDLMLVDTAHLHDEDDFDDL